MIETLNKMLELIVAVDENYGIGYKGKLPWKCPEELALFKEKTENSVVLFGTTTCANLPHLPNRQVICLSRNHPDTTKWKNEVILIKHISELKLITGKRVFIAGGGIIYRIALENSLTIGKIHISILKSGHIVDTYFDKKWLENFVIAEKKEYNEFTHLVMDRTADGERQYINLLKNIISNGIRRVGRNGGTRSLFVEHTCFNLQNGFPLLTTKKMYLRGIIEEFLFFIRGDTDTNILSERGVHIWEANTSDLFLDSRNLPYARGIMGPMYGYQWRRFGQEYIIDEDGFPVITHRDVKKNGIDQLTKVIELIKTDPHSRRILMTSYNPAQAEEGVLYPCHSLMIQFYVDEENLDMFCFNRSQDIFLGVPFNIASSALLLMVVGKLTSKTPRYLKISMGDTHLYEEHILHAKEQIERSPYKLPKLIIPNIDDVRQLEIITYEDFRLETYTSHPSIKATMIA
jgi:thymidylate synthase/dihydrofolate reductase